MNAVLARATFAIAIVAGLLTPSATIGVAPGAHAAGPATVAWAGGPGRGPGAEIAQSVGDFRIVDDTAYTNADSSLDNSPRKLNLTTGFSEPTGHQSLESGSLRDIAVTADGLTIFQTNSWEFFARLNDSGPTEGLIHGHGFEDLVVDNAGFPVLSTRQGRLFRVAPNGALTTLAGGGTDGDGPALSAALLAPGAMDTDAAGNIYIAEIDGHRVRLLDTAGMLTTVAGNGAAGTGSDGPALAAQFNSIVSVAFDDTTASLYVVDTAAGTSWRLRRITAGQITTITTWANSLLGKDPYNSSSGFTDRFAAIDVSAAGDLYMSTDARLYRVDGVGGLTRGRGRRDHLVCPGERAGDGRPLLRTGHWADGARRIALPRPAGRQHRRASRSRGHHPPIRGYG